MNTSRFVWKGKDHNGHTIALSNLRASFCKLVLLFVVEAYVAAVWRLLLSVSSLQRPSFLFPSFLAKSYDPKAQEKAIQNQ